MEFVVSVFFCHLKVEAAHLRRKSCHLKVESLSPPSQKRSSKTLTFGAVESKEVECRAYCQRAHDHGESLGTAGRSKYLDVHRNKKTKIFFLCHFHMHRHFPFSVACSCSRRVLWILWGWCVVRRLDSHCGGQRLVVVGGKTKSIWISLDVVGRCQGDKVTTRGDKVTTRGDNNFHLR